MPKKIFVEFKFDEAQLRKVLELYLTLPIVLRPDRWSASEKGKTTAITSRSDFINLVTGQKSSFFMRGKAGTLYMIMRGGNDINGDCYFLRSDNWLSASPSNAQQFFTHMAQANPFFGFACSQEELEQRNRIRVQVDAMNLVEDWAGRDPKRSLPGLYWLTLISKKMTDLHGIPTERIAKISLEQKTMTDNSTMLRFYDAPEDWSSTEMVKQMILTLPNTIDIEAIRATVKDASSLQEYMQLMRRWP